MAPLTIFKPVSKRTIPPITLIESNSIPKILSKMLPVRSTTKNATIMVIVDLYAILFTSSFEAVEGRSESITALTPRGSTIAIIVMVCCSSRFKKSIIKIQSLKLHHYLRLLQAFCTVLTNFQ